MASAERPLIERMGALIGQVKAAGLYPDIPIVTSAATEPVVEVGGKEHLLFSSNNILGLSSHPEVKAAAVAALERYGLGSGGSRSLTANIDVHVELEQRVAEFMGRESAICFATGYMANVGVIPALMKIDFLASLDIGDMKSGFRQRRSDWASRGRWALFSEELVHASGVDGVRLSRSDVQIYPHKDMAALDAALARSDNPSKLIVSDGVFSMDGDIAPIPAIAKLAKAHDALVMIDDAHGIGVLGANGRGSVEHLGVASEDVPILMGTFTKAFGGIGGFIAGDRALIDFLRVSARTYIFSAPLPPALSAGLIKAVEIVGKEPWRREKALENAGYFRREAEALGFDTLGSEAHIVPVLIGRESHAGRATAFLRERGIIAPNARFPAVAAGRARLRFVMTCDHSREQVDYLLACLKELRAELELPDHG
jgi:8-amino-7-oxononanoate synthase